MTPARLARRTFHLEDQISYAGISGDWNPIHVDPVFARRTSTGAVVHGMHLTAWAVDSFLSSTDLSPGALSATFLKPVNLGSECMLTALREKNCWRLNIHHEDELSTTIRIFEGTVRFREDCPPRQGPYPCRTPDDVEFPQAAGTSGALSPESDAATLRRLFPSLVEHLGGLRTSALNRASTVVGMHCPGRHSLLCGLEAAFIESTAPDLNYQVVRATHPSAPIKIAINGAGISGTVSAFFRPTPAVQAAYADCRARVEPDEFKGQFALIVGGSRGLGEVTAKLICGGNGAAVTTYHEGAEDGERVSREISTAGGNCATFSLDVREPGKASGLEALLSKTTHLYYFATPPIKVSPHQSFRSDLLRRYSEFYVEAFARICRMLPEGRECRIFYPSSIFVEETPKGAAEYAAAKAAGETLCRALSVELPDLKFFVERLPRASTDQTRALMALKTQDPLDVMLPIVRKMR